MGAYNFQFVFFLNNVSNNFFVIYLTGSATNSDSMLSFSSSGVSSTGSLHLSTASEVEDVMELEPDAHFKMHISSTYICNSEAPKGDGTNIEGRRVSVKKHANVTVS